MNQNIHKSQGNAYINPIAEENKEKLTKLSTALQLSVVLFFFTLITYLLLRGFPVSHRDSGNLKIEF